MEYGRQNGYNAVWVPLRRSLADGFNATAAWEFVEQHLGVDYGWEIVLMGLLDTEVHNYSVNFWRGNMVNTFS